MSWFDKWGEDERAGDRQCVKITSLGSGVCLSHLGPTRTSRPEDLLCARYGMGAVNNHTEEGESEKSWHKVEEEKLILASRGWVLWFQFPHSPFKWSDFNEMDWVGPDLVAVPSMCGHTVSAQLCRTPCTCPWPPPRCPQGVPLVLDGCGCCRVCARRLGESCDHIHICDSSQGLVCQLGAGPGSQRGVCLVGDDDDGSCEVNGRLYRDGEAFQPHCRILCRCEDGGFTCLPLCREDVRLPSWDCPRPRRVEVPGRCCPEWVCDQEVGLGDAHSTFLPLGRQLSALGVSCPEWSTAWGPCSTTCGLGVATRVSNQNRFCQLETQRRLCLPRPCPPARGHSPPTATLYPGLDPELMAPAQILAAGDTTQSQQGKNANKTPCVHEVHTGM
ncbi:PREDICTED: WNT1-inducible-signaling pathway protein 2 [Dipodomys ordii]|uniref:CCN family member 5 n=1 Tax=Dipodomys ordii TaxID=10020 RepID=A0A1S3EP56_DIPOR|nr:PREDICTED: WNT1-inducible-signaling pathway protein 2 [Dipodomys ordii]